MRYFFLILISVLFFQCNKRSEKDNSFSVAALVKKELISINDLEVLKKDLTLNQLEGKWYYNSLPFNGYSLKFYENGKLAERLGFYNGKKEGVAKVWSKNGVLRIESFYNQNKLNSSYKCWYENGVLSLECNYEDGQKQGLERQWHSNGQLAKKRNLLNDKEHGLQQAWLRNGKIYINYEAKNGRVFGLKRANLCYQLEDETIIRKAE